MTNLGPLVSRDGSEIPFVVLRQQDEWGLATADLLRPPGRLFADQSTPPSLVEPGVDARRLHSLLTPSQLLRQIPDDDNWPAQSRRSVARLWAFFLICEDPQRRLDAREVNTLQHQVSVVRHVLDNPHLRRVLIADEVGLGKTVEVGLLIKELLEANLNLRVLYLAPARLVSNVRREFDRLALHFRQWSAVGGDARLAVESGPSDNRIIASIHRAVHGNHYERVVNTQPWDVIVVDECHHLTDWAFGGGDPQEKYKLVRELIAKQKSGECRVVFLSGTPHQGNISRFDNLLKLLRDSKESAEALSGRVIYRTKDDVRDWHGKPLFPQRQVNQPVFIDLTPAYQHWIQSIHEFYQPHPGGQFSEARQRAAGWRCAQALQWAASSPSAGLGYLVRQAIRAEWTPSNKTLKDAISALRPYRGGPIDESVSDLFVRIQKEVKHQQSDPAENEAEDLEDVESDENSETRELEALLKQGVIVFNEFGDHKWNIIKNQILDVAPTEKFVLFAQPIETVSALCQFIKRVYRETPAVIMGGQSDAERTAQVNKFWEKDGPRFLVSSRAGGEGINLQIARRLIHIDVPWNPMELEQRVGRIHRFGSRQTIIVDTIVVQNSRETRAYQIAREKLKLIVGTLVEPERFENVFARVMCCLPPTELQEFLNREPLSDFASPEREQLSRMVQEGYNSWKNFNDRFSEQQKQIRMLNPGLATWDDIAAFLEQNADAVLAEGFKAQKFEWKDGQIDAVEDDVKVLRFKDSDHFVCGDYAGSPIFGPDGKNVHQLGLNHKTVIEVMRRLAFPKSSSGAAHLRWKTGLPLPSGVLDNSTFGVLVFLKQTVRADQQTLWSEQNSMVHCYIFLNTSDAIELTSTAEKRKLLAGLFNAIVRTKPEEARELISCLVEQESTIGNVLRKPTDQEISNGVRHAVTPLFAGVVTV